MSSGTFFCLLSLFSNFIGFFYYSSMSLNKLLRFIVSLRTPLSSVIFLLNLNSFYFYCLTLLMNGGLINSYSQSIQLLLSSIFYCAYWRTVFTILEGLLHSRYFKYLMRYFWILESRTSLLTSSYKSYSSFSPYLFHLICFLWFNFESCSSSFSSINFLVDPSWMVLMLEVIYSIFSYFLVSSKK